MVISILKKGSEEYVGLLIFVGYGVSYGRFVIGINSFKEENKFF